ncbi:MAG: DUF177 domain-containing protein [Firmicutes bacterium]|nr:DUF177 domain-containing protein [Bacillota bacterium]
MKINISSIREIRGDSLQFYGRQDIDLSDPNVGFKITGPVEVEGSVTNTGAGFLVSARLFFPYQASCGRCLETYSAGQTMEINEQFISKSKLDGDETPEYTFYGDEIDLKECIQEQVLLALPMSYICNPGCRGLCPGCGCNLNSTTCKCVVSTINPQFEKLKVLLSQEGGGSDGKSQK